MKVKDMIFAHAVARGISPQMALSMASDAVDFLAEKRLEERYGGTFKINKRDTTYDNLFRKQRRAVHN